MPQQWDSHTILNITKEQKRCCGWAPSKNRDCHSRINATNRLEAQRLLTTLSARSPSSDGVLSELNKLAHCLLCQRDHQDQAASVVDKWQEKISDFVQSGAESEDGDTETDDGADGEHTVDVREQLAECQQLLTRVATALESLLNAQRRFETFSVGSNTSTDTIRAQSTVESETPRSESASRDLESEHAVERPTAELNLDHVQALVRQLTLEHEASLPRRGRTARFEEDESRQGVVGSASSSTVSSQTLLPGERGHELQAPEPEQRLEGQMESTAIPPQVEDRNNTSDEHSSSETIATTTIGVTETEDDQPGNQNDTLTYVNLPLWSSALDYARSTLFGRDASAGICDGVWHQLHSGRSRGYTNLVLLSVALYLGVILAWYLQVLQTSGPRQLTLDGYVTHQIGTIAGQTDVRGPRLSSLAIARY